MYKDSSEDKIVADNFANGLLPAQKGRFKKQIEFILEVDKLKLTMRETILTDRSRRENSAEHSWHITLLVLVLSEYAKEKDLDFFRVVKMLLIHDLIEIDAGDTYCYDKRGRKDQAQRERKAADRIFNILPSDQAVLFRELWDEFEAGKTPESRFANALDRFQPFLFNYFTEGQTWKKNNVDSSQVIDRMQPVESGSLLLWNYIADLIDDAVSKGYLSK
ncbi:MAG: HD domain-containing protein [Desulfobacterales bacterium]|nr:MAG: HD domain-containing protein [Desulfobacterales bacterium]